MRGQIALTRQNDGPGYVAQGWAARVRGGAQISRSCMALAAPADPADALGQHLDDPVVPARSSQSSIRTS
jgi:hypothetical protein